MFTFISLSITLLLLAAIWFTTKIVFKIILAIIMVPFLLSVIVLYADVIICVLIVMGIIKLVSNKKGGKSSKRKRK